MGLGLSNPTHIMFIAVVLLLVFGAKRLPEMGRSLGEGMRGFKDSLGGESHSDVHAELIPAPATVTAATAAQPPVHAAADTVSQA